MLHPIVTASSVDSMCRTWRRARVWNVHAFATALTWLSNRRWSSSITPTSVHVTVAALFQHSRRPIYIILRSTYIIIIIIIFRPDIISNILLPWKVKMSKRRLQGNQNSSDLQLQILLWRTDQH